MVFLAIIGFTLVFCAMQLAADYVHYSALDRCAQQRMARQIKRSGCAIRGAR